MQLDFLTLYLIILLNSITVAVLWAAISATYRNFVAARYWLAANLLTTFGGGVLALEGESFNIAVAICGNLIIIAGFATTWLGIRVFYDLRPQWRLFTSVLAISLGAMLIADATRPSQNVIYALGEIVALGFGLSILLRQFRVSLGAAVAACAIGLAMIGFTSEAVSNLMRLAGVLTTEAYYAVASYFLVATLFGGSLWNFGFLLMAFDRLRTELLGLASTDELTGLTNRRGFMQLAPGLIADNRRRGKPLSVLMIDVDKLKEINDRHGHAAGDACLARFARIASDQLPPNSLLARMGGDEFCAIIADCGAVEAERLAAELENACSDQNRRDSPIAMSITIGTATTAARSRVDLPGMMEESDAALYVRRKRLRGSHQFTVEVS